MTINLSFAEISEYVKKHCGKSLVFSNVSDREIRVAYEQRILFRTVQIPVNITINKVLADSVTLSYNGNFGIDMVISGVIVFLKAKVPELADLLATEEDHKIHVNLSKLQQTAKLVEAVALEDIVVKDSNLEVKVRLK